MHDTHAKNRPRHPWRVALSLFCVLVLMFGATVQLAHIHAPEQVSHAGCALCATAHVVIAPAAPATAPLPVKPVMTRLIEIQAKFPRRTRDFSLFTRPPPVVIAFS